MDPAIILFIVAPITLAAWDVGRRFAQAHANRALEARIAALESIDHTRVDQRLAALEHGQTTTENRFETIRAARTGSRWGA